MVSAQSINIPMASNVDLFDVYFRRISGTAAVAFLQGSGLSNQVWAYADKRQTGFLGRAEFYKALRLVTLAQSKQQLTPEIVKAALYGPEAVKIPPPQINLSIQLL